MVTGSLEEQTVARLERELEIRDREEHAARREMMRLTERLAQQTRELARTRRLEQTVSALSVALRQTGADIERALDSRAWRLGHSITRTLSRIARRPVRTEGALVAALARIERVQSVAQIDAPQRAAGRTGPATQRARPSTAPWSPTRDEPLTPAEARQRRQRRGALAADLRRRLGPPPESERWPSVSIVVPTRDGRRHLERL